MAESSMPVGHARARPRSPLRWLTPLLAVTLLATVAILALSFQDRWAPAPAATQSGPSQSIDAYTASMTLKPVPEQTPETQPDAAEELLANAPDPEVCAVSFMGDGIDHQPVLETRGTLFQNLPILKRDGLVFAGWYSTAEAADSLDHTQRLNGAKTVDCDDRRLMLYAAWVSPERNVGENAQIPILMYHWFTTNPEGEDHWLKGNFVFVDDFESHLEYIAAERFYLPTWPELDAFIDGDLFLPDKSVIVTDDDAKQSWLDLAAPLVEKYQVMTTSFVIGVKGAGPELSQWVLKRSHTFDMHSAGADGQGRIVNWSADEIAEDLNESAKVLGGAKEVLAYPFGHTTTTPRKRDSAKPDSIWRGRPSTATSQSGLTSSRSPACALIME